MHWSTRLYYRALLTAQFFERTGQSFQDYFCEIMTAIYGGDFSRSFSAGQLGDRGCDGLRHSTGTLYQVWGHDPEAPLKTTTLQDKIATDFARGLRHFGEAMREWRFAHNMKRGLPTDALITIEKLALQHPRISIAPFGPQAIRDLLLAQPIAVVEALLGPSGSTEVGDPDYVQVQVLLKAVASSAPSKGTHPKRVPRKKIAYNELGPDSADLLVENRRFERQVQQLVSGNTDAQFGDKVANALNTRYLQLSADLRSPDDVLQSLIEYVQGENRISTPTLGEQRAAAAIVSYFFFTCDVFEDAPRSA